MCDFIEWLIVSEPRRQFMVDEDLELVVMTSESYVKFASNLI